MDAGKGVGFSPSDVTGAKLVEMAVGPAHGRLDGQVQPMSRMSNVERHLDAAQYRGFDAVEGDLSRATAAALMPLLYDAPSRQPSSRAEARRACGLRDRRSEPGLRIVSLSFAVVISVASRR